MTTTDVWSLRLCPQCERDLAMKRLKPYCDHPAAAARAAIRPPKLPTTTGDPEVTTPATEPEFYPDWYDRGIASQHIEGEPVGNEAYIAWMERVLDAATKRKIDWAQVELAIVLDRAVIRDEARRGVLREPERYDDYTSVEPIAHRFTGAAGDPS